MAGKVSGTIKAMGIVLAQDQLRQVLALDQEFASMESKINALQVEKVKLEARVNPLEREVEKLKQTVEKNQSAANAGGLPGEVEAILVTVANHEAPKEQIIAHMNLSAAKGDYYFDLLRSNGLIIESHATDLGIYYKATPKGREYLAKHDLLK